MKRLSPGSGRASLVLRLLLVSLAGLATTAGCPPTGGTGTDGTGTGNDSVITDVRIEGFTFSPNVVTIKKGTQVRWTNYDPLPHTVTSGTPGAADAGDLFDADPLNSGQPFTHQFDEVGEFVYFCRRHAIMPTMRDAKVIVEE